MEVAAVGWVVSPIIAKLINTCYDCFREKLKWPTGMKKELERLQENHLRIQAVVSAASQAQKIDPNSPLNKWIWQLRDAIDEADDVLDDFEYIKHEEQLARTKVSSTMRKLKKIGKRALKKDPNLKRLEEVVHKLDKILTEVDTFLRLLGGIEQVQQEQLDKLQNDRETGFMPKDYLIGRDKYKESIVQWLKKLPNEEHQSHVSGIPMYHNISLLSVVGDGGMGKTTLLQHVYQDEITREFDLKMWVCVSTDVNVKKVTADVLESLKKTRPSSESLDALQNSLRSEVMSKKFLLILDDIWEEDEERDKSKWETILAPLACGGLGSKILLTTRMSSAALMIAKVIKQKNEVLNLKGLEECECLQLLNTHAFAFAENLNEHHKLRSIAGELVKKLYGSPLAAKVIGGVLNSNLVERHWTKVLNNDLGGHNGIFSILRLSYMFLPIYLQNCFAFCSIFEQDHVFDKDDLIRMWIAVGFIHQPSCIRGETLEDIGERYFDILVKKSFFDMVKYGYKMNGYKMHDLLHELAQSVSAQECRRIVGNEDSDLRIPETVRHLFVETLNLEQLRKLGKFKNLRTLCIRYYGNTNAGFVNVLAQIFEVTRSIRLLSIYAGVIPETIRCLKHLGYLYLPLYSNTLLPRSVSNLYHMQFLILSGYSSHVVLFPRDMNNLSNLRYLKSPHFKFSGIGKLKFLQEVKGYVVKNETGYKIEELEHMNDIHILEIRGLKNVRDAEEGCKAKLYDKRKLTDLSLKWKEEEWEANSQNTADFDIYARVFDNLQPHNNLKKLTMYGYMGVRSARWMNNDDLIKNLEHIKLVGCLEWKNLPTFSQLPFLKSLELRDMPKAGRLLDNKYHGNDVHCLFPSLEVLSIANLEALEDWFDAGDDCLFPCLTVIELYNCPNLQGLPYLPPKLETLKAKNIGWKTLNFCCSILGPFGTFHVSDCPNISSIDMNWKIIGRPGVLKKMELEDCPNLLSIGGHQEAETTENCLNLIVDKLKISDASVLQMEPMRSITSVRMLTIKDNFDDGVASFPFEAERWFLQVRSSLCELHFSNLKSLQSLPSSLTSLSSLETLHMENLPQLNLQPSSLSTISSLKEIHLRKIPLLKSLPYLPPSLSKLYLEDLDNLNCLPSCLPSLSSLTLLEIHEVPQLRELPGLPPSLHELHLEDLENLNSLPSCLPILSSLTSLAIDKVPQLRELPDLPPSLHDLWLYDFDNLNSLPSCLPSLSSLTSLYILKVPQLRELPDLPPSLHELHLEDLDNLNSLPSCLPSLYYLIYLHIIRVPQLRELPDLPPSLKTLNIKGCDPELMKRYEESSIFGWNK